MEDDDAASTSDAFKAGLSALVLHFANELVFAPHGGCPSLLGVVSVIKRQRILSTEQNLNQQHKACFMPSFGWWITEDFLDRHSSPS